MFTSYTPQRRMKILELCITSLTVLLWFYSVSILHTRVNSWEPNVCQCKCNSSVSTSTSTSTIPLQNFDHKYMESTSFVPPGPSSLNKNHLDHSLTRVGNELKFDVSYCPPQSIMLTEWKRVKPVHSSCPAVFVIGARKAGTTSLYQYLSHHPDFEGIHLEDGPTAGETFHFSARYSTERWNIYKARFPKLSLMTGDASVGNFVNCEVPRRIFESCGNFSRVLILLRNPVDRYVSNFLMRTKLGTRKYSSNTALSTVIKLEMSSFYNLILSKGIHVETGPEQWAKHCCMFAPSTNMLYEGLYYVHLMNWLCNFPAENILIMNSEEFYSNTTYIMQQVYQFLGLSPLSNDHRQLVTSFVFNKGAASLLSHQMLQDTDKKKINHLYKPFNKALIKLLQWNNIW